jgi:7-cyano-7-deazaguanine synthase
MSRKRVLVSLSGGMDSATLLARAIEHGHDIECVSFFYGSKHNLLEDVSAAALCAHYGVPRRVVNMVEIGRHLTSALMGNDDRPVPEGHYEEETMRDTVVPARNIIFISVMAGIANSHKFSEIWLGVHAGDHFIYPDCRPRFISFMQQALNQGLSKYVEVGTPFLFLNKTDILSYGLSCTPPVPYHLTRTCYTTSPIACGKCGSCQERLEAFRNNHTEDPLQYQTREILPKKEEVT